MKRRNTQTSRDIVKEIGLGVCGTLVDVTLFLVCFGAGYVLGGMSSSKGYINLRPLKMMMKNYPQWRIRLRNALYLAKRDDYLTSIAWGNDRSIGYMLTQKAVDRLASLLPRYKRQSIWSGSLWLVSYDISDERKKDREALRRFLLSQGYGKLQESIYLAPFDPTDAVKSTVDSLNIQGEVLISRMGETGHIGNMFLSELIATLYPLKSVQIDYQQYINRVNREVVRPQTAPFLLLEYLSILKADPQLPKELLANDWPGDQAYEITKSRVLPQLIDCQASAYQLLEKIL